MNTPGVDGRRVIVVAATGVRGAASGGRGKWVLERRLRTGEVDTEVFTACISIVCARVTRGWYWLESDLLAGVGPDVEGPKPTPPWKGFPAVEGEEDGWMSSGVPCELRAATLNRSPNEARTDSTPDDGCRDGPGMDTDADAAGARVGLDIA